MFCKMCGTQLPEGAMFCGNCGAQNGIHEENKEVGENEVEEKEIGAREVFNKISRNSNWSNYTTFEKIKLVCFGLTLITSLTLLVVMLTGLDPVKHANLIDSTMFLGIIFGTVCGAWRTILVIPKKIFAIPVVGLNLITIFALFMFKYVAAAFCFCIGLFILGYFAVIPSAIAMFVLRK